MGMCECGCECGCEREEEGIKERRGRKKEGYLFTSKAIWAINKFWMTAR